MEIAKFERKMYRTTNGYYGIPIPRSVGDAMGTKNMELIVQSDGCILIRPMRR